MNQSKSSRVHYKPKWITLNGHLVHGLVPDKTKVSVTFELAQCFCNCSIYSDVHYTDCPNAKGTIIGFICNGQRVMI